MRGPFVGGSSNRQYDMNNLRALAIIYLVNLYPKMTNLGWLHLDFRKNLEQFLITMEPDIYQEGHKYQLTPEAYERYSMNLEHSCEQIISFKEVV